MMRKFSFLDCQAELVQNRLSVGNSKIKRTWLITDKGIVPESLTDMETDEILTCENTQNITPAEITESPSELILEGITDDDYGFSKKFLKASLTVNYTDFSLKLDVVMYPEIPIIRTRIFVRGKKQIQLKNVCDLDNFNISDKHCEWENIFIRAVTDSHNNLVQKENGLFYLNEKTNLSGNILKVHRTLKNDGIVLIKESPAVDEQVRYPGYDFMITGRNISICSAGFLNSDITNDEYIPLYGSAAGIYHGDDFAFYRLLNSYHNARHDYNEKHDGNIICNTWGDSSGGSKLYEQFIQDELDAAHEIGISCYQIDAGWDTGETIDDTKMCKWIIKYSNFPYGFMHINEKIKKYGMTLGLWFVPDSNDGNDYDNYKRDAQILIDLYRNHNIKFFKLDGFKLLSYLATYRFEKMLMLVLDGTGGDVSFNIDITNWPRTGFFGATQYSNLFMENRYTDHLSYYPHYTLRNLWLISRYIPTYRIQTEFLNVERNSDKYGQDDMLSPDKCGEDYAFAVTLFSSPLAWFETTGLNNENKNAIMKIVKAIKGIHPDILKSLVLPIGNTPNGTEFTGFQAIKDENSGYLLFLKELNKNESYRYTSYTQNFSKNTSFDLVVSNCKSNVTVMSKSELYVSMDGKFSFAVYRYSI